MHAITCVSRRNREFILSNKDVNGFVLSNVCRLSFYFYRVNHIVLYQNCYSIGLLTLRILIHSYMFLLQSYFQLLMYSNSATNPVLYAFLGDQFKKGFKRVVGKGSRRGFSSHPQRTMSTRTSTM